MDRDDIAAAAKNIGNAIDNAKDAMSEAAHRAEAEAERKRRSVTGDTMTGSEKVGSMANEVKNDAQAEIDRAKRDVRNA